MIFIKQLPKIKNINQRLSAGFTILETMIAISLFVSVVMVGMTALLNVNVVNQKSQGMRSIMDNLSFIMEDMSRNIRTGYHYRCYDSTLVWNQSFAQTAGLNTPRSCAGGGVLVFEEARGHTPTSTVPDTNATDQWIYQVVSSDGGVTYNINKSIDGGSSWVQLNPTEVVLSSVSGFSVLGAEPPSGNTQQPLVTIRLIGTITIKNVVTPFNLQTSVSQRLIDV